MRYLSHLLFIVALFLLTLVITQQAYANNCALGQAQICSASFGGAATSKLCTSIHFTPASPTIGGSISASVWANNAQRVDASLYSPNGTLLGSGNGIPCSGTTCTFAFPSGSTKTAGTYKVNFNAWDKCGGVVHNHEAYNTVSVSTVPTSSIAPTSPTGQIDTTTGNIALHFEAIDSVNNTHPSHPTRLVSLYFYTDTSYTTDPVGAHAKFGPVKDTVTFSGGTDTTSDLFGTFINSAFKLGAIPTGNYYILAKSPEGSLRTLLSPNPIPITAGKNNTLVSTSTTNGTPNIPTLLMGDITNDNTVDINDYAILVDCYGIKKTQSSCTNHNVSDATKGLFADLNDDSVVDGIDYNILIRNFNQNGN